MKKVGIHQVNYFPWSGYFNKMAKSDIFIFLDQVQLTDRGYSQRTPVISSIGQQSFLNVGVIKKGHREKEFREIMLNPESDWRERQLNFLKGNYLSHPYYKSIMDVIFPVFDDKWNTLLDVTLCSIHIIKDITKSAEGDIYLSGSGAKQYMDVKEFAAHDVNVEYQTFQAFKYPQWRLNEFVPGLSILDMLFNIGIENSRDLFWTNMQNEETIEIVDVND